MGVFPDVEIDDALRAMVAGARAGDERSWVLLVDRFDRLVWSVVRHSGVASADAAELNQIVWARLAEHLPRIQHPERLGAWLVTTTRRECRRHLRLRSRVVCEDTDVIDLRLADAPAADTPLLEAERGGELHDAIAALPCRQRRLLTMLLHEPSITYTELAEQLDMPIGSIGPTRARALSAVRRHLGPHLASTA